MFHSIYRNSSVYLNGVLLGDHSSGYTSFRYDISGVPGVHYGDLNVLAVYVDATSDEGWWYEGVFIPACVCVCHNLMLDAFFF